MTVCAPRHEFCCVPLNIIMRAPKFPSMFRITQNQRFEYKPIYYDEAEEKRKKRDKEIEAGKEGTSRGRIKFQPRGGRSLRNSNMRIALLVVLLSGLAAYIITY